MQPRTHHRPLDIVILGLTITSSWGNGHATTYRGLVRGLARARPRRPVPGARQALVRATTATCPSRPTARPALSQPRRAARPLERARSAAADLVHRRLLRARRHRGRPLGAARPRAASTAFYDIDTPVTLAALGTRRLRLPDARADPAATTSISPSPAGRRCDGWSGSYGAPAARAALLLGRSRRSTARPAVAPRWDLGYLGTYSADRQPALERLLSSRRRAWPPRPLRRSPARCTRTASRWPSNVERIEHLAARRAPRASTPRSASR